MILLTEVLSLFGQRQRAVAVSLECGRCTMSLLMNQVDMFWSTAFVVSVLALSQYTAITESAIGLFDDSCYFLIQCSFVSPSEDICV